MGLWQDSHAATINLALFRAHDQYLEQAPSYPYAAIVKYIRDRRLEHWIAQLGEDDSFGATTATVDGLVVSRDLLDSILEIGFLRSTLGLVACSALRVLDIGAGYGRLAHRFLELYPAAAFVCTDALPVSRVACQTYLAYHGVRNAAVKEPEAVDAFQADLAVNVHSWSECTMDEIEFWLQKLDWMKTPKLFIVPHTPTLGCWDKTLGGGNGPSFRPLLEAHGWRQAWHWAGPSCCPRTYLMFEREAT